MNIALFSDAFLPAKNGVVTHVNELKDGLRRRGHAVYLVTTRYPGHIDEDDGIFRLPSVKAPLGKGMEIRYAFGRQRTADGFLRDKGIDIVHTHSEFAVGRCGKKAARHLGVPHVHTFHTMWEEYRHYILSGKVLTRGMIRRIARRFLLGVSACVAPSEKSKNYVRALQPSLPVSIISNGVDVEKIISLRPSPDRVRQLRDELGLRPDDLVLIFVGRIGAEKRVLELVDTVALAAARDPRVRLLVVGDGPLLNAMRGRARGSAAPDAFLFTGFLPWEEVIARYACARLFVTVSLSEVQPMTVIEAQVCGLPLVARRDESYLGMVEHGANGLLADTDEEVTGAILDLASDPGRLKLLSAASVNRSRALSIEDTVTLMEGFYAEVISSRA